MRGVFDSGKIVGRPTLLTKALQNKIVAALNTGATIVDVCASIPLHKDTFYTWLKRGELGEVPFADFTDAISRAQQDAKMAAMKALRVAMNPHQAVSETVETFAETRLDREGKPYEYVKKVEKRTVTKFAGDWRAAIEYLKRRHYAEWGDRSKVDDWRSEAVALIREGRLSYEALIEEFGREEADRLFVSAGISGTEQGETGEGKTTE